MKEEFIGLSVGLNAEDVRYFQEESSCQRRVERHQNGATDLSKCGKAIVEVVVEKPIHYEKEEHMKEEQKAKGRTLLSAQLRN